jgi:hypothetical protein
VKRPAASLGGLVVASIFAAGCSTVRIGPGPYSVVAMEPLGGEIDKYPSNDQPVNRGELLEFQFTSGTSDIRSISKWLGLHHVYFEVCACNAVDDGTPALFSGNVHEVPTTDGIEIPKRYRAYIPLDLKQIIRQASVSSTLDASGQLKHAREHGLCIRVGGGAVWGGTLKSNSIQLPLAVEAEELRITGAVSTHATVPNYWLKPTAYRVTALAGQGPRHSGRGLAVR